MTAKRSFGMRFLTFYVFVILFYGLSGCSRTTMEGIGTLKGVQKSMDAQERAIREETRRFEKVKKEALRGALSPGMDAGKVVARYGEPNVVLQDPGARRYVYKSGQASWFGGEKVYLIFDAADSLTEVRCVGFECPPQKSS